MSTCFTKRRIVRNIALLLALFGSSAASGQETARSQISPKGGTVYPRLPEAVSKPPAWLGAEAPFDVAKFFNAPRRERNAAPLYLDALFEFGAEIAVCYPEGSERERRRLAALDRSKRYFDFVQSLSNNRSAAAPDAVCEIIKLYNVGFRKLAEAQRRDQCVFETGLSFTALLPHAQVARQVARIADLRVERAVQRGDLDAAIRDVETVLRLTRDLQARGVMITQLVRSAITQVVGVKMVAAILSSPKLQSKHCYNLLNVLAAHDQKASDGYAEGLRAEYIAVRSTIRDAVMHQRDLAARLNLKPGESVVRALFSTLNGGRNVGNIVPEDADARLARTTPAELARRERDIDRYYRTLLSFDNTPFTTRLEKTAALKTTEGSDLLSVLTGGILQPAIEPLLRATSRAVATVHATECLVALRRWQLTHHASPTSLLVAVKDAGLKAIPTDPYDGKPLRHVIIRGAPVVYSVGRDGKDDGGQKDSKLDVQAGDLLYRLPAVEERHEIRPAGYNRNREGLFHIAAVSPVITSLNSHRR